MGALTERPEEVMARAKGKKRTTKRLLGTALNERIIQLLSETPGLKTSDLAEQLGVDQLQVRNELMLLEQQQEVSRIGQTRGTRWYLGHAAAIDVDSLQSAEPRAGTRADAEGLEADDETNGPADGIDERAGARRGPKERVLDAHRELLGQIPDADVAERTGVSVRTIAGYRKKYGIAGYSGPRRRTERRDERTPESAGARSERTELRSPTSGAWRIEIRQRGETVVRYAFAGDLVEAARTASEGAIAHGGEVVSIAFAGSLL
jgi:hypothetical protein